MLGKRRVKGRAPGKFTAVLVAVAAWAGVIPSSETASIEMAVVRPNLRFMGKRVFKSACERRLNVEKFTKVTFSSQF